MKQFIFLTFMVAIGGVGALHHPFWGLLVYYTLTVLRPQHLWNWALVVDWRWSLVAAITVFVGLALNAHRLLDQVRLNGIMILMLVFSALIAISCVIAHDPVLAQRWTVEYAKIILICLVTGMIVTKLWQVQALALVVIVCLSYIAWEINSLYFFNGRLDVFHYGFSGLDNNGAGLMLAMGVPFAFAFGTSARRLWQQALCGVLAIVMLHAVMMTYSRGAMLSVGVGIFWLLLWHRSMAQRVVVGVLLAVMIPLLAGTEIRDRFISTANYQEDGSAQSRFASWAAAWEMAADHPFGQGVRNSNLLVHRYGADRVGRTIHSQYLQIAADSGLPAMTVYIVMMLLAIHNCRDVRRQCIRYLEARRAELAAKDPRAVRVYEASQIALGCQGSLIIFAFGSLFLSMEVFELPWMLLAISGVMPRVMREHLEAITDGGAAHGAGAGDAPDGPSPPRGAERAVKDRDTQRRSQTAPSLIGAPSLAMGHASVGGAHDESGLSATSPAPTPTRSKPTTRFVADRSPAPWRNNWRRNP